MKRRRNARARIRSEELSEPAIARLLPRIWPRRNRGAIPNCAELLAECQHFHILTRGQLLAALSKHRRAVVDEDQRPFTPTERRIFLSDKGEAFVSDCSRHRRFFTLEGLTRNALECEFGEKYNEYLQSHYHSSGRDSE